MRKQMKPDVTEEEKAKMRELEAEGKSRKEIALIMGRDSPTITRHLGAVRKWRDRRAA